jgi:integrase
MARTPKPYLYRGWYCTGVYGIVNHKLCPESEGSAEAAKQLGLWMAMIEDKRRLAGCDNAHKVLAINPATVTVAAALEEFMNFTRAKIGASTLRSYVARLRPFRSRFLNRPVSSLRERDGVEFKEFLMTQKEWKKGNTVVKGLGNARVNRCLTSARSFFKWCARPQRRYCTDDPWAELGRLEEKPRERLLTDDEFQILLKNTRNQNLRDVLVFLRYTACRPGEACAAHWDMVHWDRNLLVIPRVNGQGKRLTKTPTPRRVPLLPEVIAMLRERLAKCDGKGPVFPDRYGKEPVSKSLSKAFNELVKRCCAHGLLEKERAGEKLVLYATRHTRATEMLREGVDLVTVSKALGHARVSTTANVYLHLSDDEVTRTVLKARLPSP